MTPTNRDLEVRLQGRPVGLLWRRNGTIRFQLLTSYRESPERPVLGQVFEDFPSRVHKATSRLPPWFANLLPEGPLRQVIARDAGVSTEQELELMVRVGEDLPGAVTVSTTSRDMTLDEDAQLLVADEPSRMTVSAGGLRFSLAGVQLKLSAVVRDGRVTLPARGELGGWIVKLPDPRYPGPCENEFSMMSWGRASGISVPDVQLLPARSLEGVPRGLLPEAGSKILAVRRFDRVDGRRIHQKDFAQVLNVYPRGGTRPQPTTVSPASCSPSTGEPRWTSWCGVWCSCGRAGTPMPT